MVTKDELKEIMQNLLFTRSRSEYHRIHRDLTITEGVRCVVDATDCNGLIDLIYLWQSDLDDGLYIYTLFFRKGHWFISCKDTNDNVLREKMIKDIEFPVEKFTFYYQQNNILLDIEY